ncbi:MAG: hypothetical protein GC137_06915 [Alphaproteobacteria bacterium]|nr:hypothetical protein [Alphaproteobacteria bacterium]
MTSDNESQAGEIPKSGNLTDFVYGATEENKLQIEVAVKEDGRCAIFHNKPFRNELSWLEFDLDTCRLNFVLDDGEIRDLGMQLTKDMSKNMQNTHQMLMVLMDDQTGDAKEGIYVPLIIHGK